MPQWLYFILPFIALLLWRVRQLRRELTALRAARWDEFQQLLRAGQPGA